MDEATRKRLTLVACVLGAAIAFVDSTVVNVALPSLRDDLHAGLATQQWVVEAYLLTLGSLLLIGGSLGDIFGRRRVFAIGVAAFGATSLLCALAPTGGFLVAARAVQGVAGALLVPSTLAIVTATFDAGERGAAIGTWTAWTGISILVGPPIGGLLIDATSWRAIFALNVPLVLVTLALISRAVVESEDDDMVDRRVDYLGACLCALGLAGPVFALIEQPRYGWGDPLVAGPLAVGIVLLALFVLREARTTHPMMPLEVFRSRNFAIGNLATLLFYAGLGGMTFFLTLFIQQVGGFNALAAGLAFAPTTVITFFLSRRFGALVDRIGPRPLMAAGPLVAAAGILLLLRVDASVSYSKDLLPTVVLFGLGLSMTVAPLTATVLGAVEQRHAGVGSGINNAIARVAGLVAIAAIGAVVSAQFGARLDARVGDAPLPPAARAALATAKTRPLAGPRSLPPAARSRLGPAVRDASVRAFRVGMGVSAALMLLAGAISAAGLESRRRRTVAPVATRVATTFNPCSERAASGDGAPVREPVGHA